ncbi:unnamed protein product, partial [Rotaria sordida]
ISFEIKIAPKKNNNGLITAADEEVNLYQEIPVNLNTDIIGNENYEFKDKNKFDDLSQKFIYAIQQHIDCLGTSTLPKSNFESGDRLLSSTIDLSTKRPLYKAGQSKKFISNSLSSSINKILPGHEDPAN